MDKKTNCIICYCLLWYLNSNCALSIFSNSQTQNMWWFTDAPAFMLVSVLVAPACTCNICTVLMVHICACIMCMYIIVMYIYIYLSHLLSTCSLSKYASSASCTVSDVLPYIINCCWIAISCSRVAHIPTNIEHQFFVSVY